MDIAEKVVLLTGGHGFLGGHLQKKLLEYGVSSGRLCIVSHRDYDLCSENDVQKLYSDVNPDIVIHLAAEVGGIGANRENPGRYFYANMAMGLNLIEYGRLNEVEKIVQVGTICAYPKFTPVPFKEENLWNGYPEETNAPYGIAKKALLVMLQAYRQQYGFNGIYLLPVNLYGPGDNFDLETSHVIPALIRKFTSAVDNDESEVVVWGTGSASREFLYVKDAAEAIAKATVGYDKADPVNLGSGMEITISDLVEVVAEMTGYKGEIVLDKSKPDGQPRRCLDVSKARNEFGFRAKTPFREGLKATIDWWKNNKY